MRNALGILLLLGVGCSSTDTFEEPDVAVTAVKEAEGTRVQFQLNKGQVSAHAFELKADGGELLDVCRSTDLRRVSALWTSEEGKLTCVFPYAQTGEWEAGGALLKDRFTYVFHQSDRGRVSASVPRGAPMRPRLLLSVIISKKNLPATLQWTGREVRHLTREDSLLAVQLPMDENKILASGDWKITLTTKAGSAEFVIGVDPDGTPTAPNGYVQRQP